MANFVSSITQSSNSNIIPIPIWRCLVSMNRQIRYRIKWKERIFLLFISLFCHLYVNIVAHRHSKTIYKTQRSHHASLQRINSISAFNKESVTPNQAFNMPPSFHNNLSSSALPKPLQMTKRRIVLFLLLPPRVPIQASLSLLLPLCLSQSPAAS